METNLTIISESENEITISYPFEEVKGDFAKEVAQKVKKLEIPGFRKGKAPMSFIKRLYGDALEYEAAEKIANTKFWDYVDTQDIKLVGKPSLTDIDFKPDELLKFTIRYECFPNLDVKGYKDNVIDLPEIKVEESYIDEEVVKLQIAASTTELADEVVDKFHKITVSLKKILDDGTVEETTFQNDLPIELYNERVNPSIAENAIGKKVGESFQFSLIDEHHHNHDHDHSDEGHDHHHEPLKFTYEATISKIEKVILKELEEEFIKKETGNRAATIDEFKSLIRTETENYNNGLLEEMFLNSITQKIIDANPFTPPKSVVVDLFNKSLEDRKKDKKKPATITDEEIEKLKSNSEFSVKWLIISEKIQKIENVELTDEVIQSIAEIDAKKMGYDPEIVKNYYKSNKSMHPKLLEKALDLFLLKNNKMNLLSVDEYTNKRNMEKIKNSVEKNEE